MGGTCRKCCYRLLARQAWIDDHGGLLIETDLGIRAIHDHDLPEVLAHLIGPGGEVLAEQDESWSN